MVLPSYLSQADINYMTNSKIIVSIATPIHVFGIYLILFRTPQKMQQMKYNLLLLHLCTSLVDITLSALFIPVINVPAMMAYTLGLLSYPLGVPVIYQSYFLSVALGCFGASISGAFENRYYRLVRHFEGGVFDSKFRTTANIINYMVSTFYFAPVYLTSPEPEYGKKYYRELYPQLDPSIFLHENLYVVHLDWRVPCLLGLITGVFYLTQIFRYFLGTLFYLYSSKSERTSQNTLKMQKKLFFAIFLQISVPLLFVVIPGFWFGFSFLAQVKVDEIILACLYSFESHGIIASIVMIFVHEPYRQATLYIIFRKKPTVTIASSKTSRISVYSTL